MDTYTAFARMHLGVGLAALVVHLGLLWHDRAMVVPDDVAPAYFTLG